MVAAGALTAPMQAQAASPLKVETKEGPVKGFLKNGVAEFLGIPYAAPPVGNLRWKPPQKHAPWTNVLQATAFGPTCAQITELGVVCGSRQQQRRLPLSQRLHAERRSGGEREASGHRLDSWRRQC